MIRRAVTGDFEAINGFDVFAGDRRREIADGRCLVSEAHGCVVGYISWAPKGFIGRDYVTALCIGEAHRRTGRGAALLAAAEAEIGSGRLFISTEADNAPMLALLARGGWTPAGCVAGANRNEVAECFFYKDLPATDNALKPTASARR